MKSSYFVGQSNSSFSYSQNSYSYAYSQAQNKHDNWMASDSEKLREIVEATEESVSWAAVASEVFSSTGNSHSPISCYIQYTNVTDIIINKENWTDEEDNLLIYLAKKYREHNWSEIACELGTNRTPFECIKRHQQNFNARLLNEGDWSTDEDSELRNAVLMYGVCWDRVASVVRGRTADQCNRRWSRNSLAEGASAGKFWSEEEQATLLMAAKAFGVPSIAQSYELCAQRRDMLLSIREPKKTDIDMIEAVLPFDNKNYDLESSFVTEWGKIAALLPGRCTEL